MPDQPSLDELLAESRRLQGVLVHAAEGLGRLCDALAKTVRETRPDLDRNIAGRLPHEHTDAPGAAAE